MNCSTLQCHCREVNCKEVVRYKRPPVGETKFSFTDSYDRSYESCTICGHMFSRHKIDLSSIYQDDYVDSTYGNLEGMRRRFNAVMNLPHDKSDNRARVRRVLKFEADRNRPKSNPRLLDVGAGLGVFPAAMSEAGWSVLAIEPDARTVYHLQNVALVDALCENLINLNKETVGLFDAITFNKVLEHVVDPVNLLSAANSLLTTCGFVYLEVPDVAAAQDGYGREEFFIEHHHVFSPASLCILAQNSGFKVSIIERIREPSSKFTLRCFLTSSA
jgi:SAM-dependent methyltransferase